jgi:hypothetical protein
VVSRRAVAKQRSISRCGLMVGMLGGMDEATTKLPLASSAFRLSSRVGPSQASLLSEMQQGMERLPRGSIAAPAGAGKQILYPARNDPRGLLHSRV